MHLFIIWTQVLPKIRRKAWRRLGVCRPWVVSDGTLTPRKQKKEKNQYAMMRVAATTSAGRFGTADAENKEKERKMVKPKGRISPNWQYPDIREGAECRRCSSIFPHRRSRLRPWSYASMIQES